MDCYDPESGLVLLLLLFVCSGLHKRGRAMSTLESLASSYAFSILLMSFTAVNFLNLLFCWLLLRLFRNSIASRGVRKFLDLSFRHTLSLFLTGERASRNERLRNVCTSLIALQIWAVDMLPTPEFEETMITAVRSAYNLTERDQFLVYGLSVEMDPLNVS